MLKNAILKTLTYFDLWGQALTPLEICKFLIKPEGHSLQAGLGQVYESLIQLKSEGKVDEENGLYVLPRRKDLVQKRLDLYSLYMKRMNKAARAVKIMRYVPYVRGIAVGGSLAQMRSRESSDIDFFLITKPGRVWLARLNLSAVAQILGIRRHGRKIADRICLNHYVVSDFTLKQDRTLYAAIEYASLLSLLSPKAFSDFYKKQTWLGDFLVNPPAEGQLSVLTVSRSKILQPTFEFIFEILGATLWEKIARILQVRRIQPQEGIILSEYEISLHPDPKGIAFMRKFRQR